MTTLARMLQSRGTLDSPWSVYTSILSVTFPLLMVNCLLAVVGTLEFFLIMISFTYLCPSCATDSTPSECAVTSETWIALRPVAVLLYSSETIAAPLATARSVSAWEMTSLPVRSLRNAATLGILVEPPTRRISSMSVHASPSSSIRLMQTSFVAVRRCSVMDSNSPLSRVYLALYPS